ncbi:MAG: urease accessory protein UreF [Anaerolineales bacterium]|nr:urease accessory protein UreF [Anaerolineales bacterium]
MLAVLRVLQFGDSMLPIGAFSFSNGLESAVATGLVRDESTLREFVYTVVEQAATGDCIALLHAHRAAARHDLAAVVLADQAVMRRKLNEEMRLMTVRMGRKFGELGEFVHSVPLMNGWLEAIKTGATPGTFVAGVAVLLAGLGISERECFAVHQYGVATMVLGAALRLMKINHLTTQAILFAVNGEAPAAFARIAGCTLDDMATFAPVADVLAAIHVKAHVRMFMN